MYAEDEIYQIVASFRSVHEIQSYGGTQVGHAQPAH